MEERRHTGTAATELPLISAQIFISVQLNKSGPNDRGSERMPETPSLGSHGWRDVVQIQALVLS